MSDLLNDTWALAWHDPFSADWTMQSYERLGDIGSIDEFWAVHDAIAPFLPHAMWFLFREHIFPMWDDPANINGGTISMKVLKSEAKHYWETLCCKMLGETLLKNPTNDTWSLVNGLSVSPKKSFVIVKVWIGSECIGDPALFDLDPAYAGDVLFRSNRDNISANNARLAT